MNDKQIVEMYTEKNLSTYEIAKEMNTYPNKIRRVLIKNRVQLNDKSTAQKNAIQKGVASIPTKGKKRTKEEKLKISNSLEKYWKQISKEEYARRVDFAKEKWNNMSKEDKENMQASAIKAIQIAGKHGSKLENFVAREIKKEGINVVLHKKNLIPNENLEIDMYCPEIKCIIEIDGPSHFLPIWGEEKLRKQIKADSQKTGLILNKGFAIIRVKHTSDSPSLASKDRLKNQIMDILNSMKDKFPPKSQRYIEIEI